MQNYQGLANLELKWDHDICFTIPLQEHGNIKIVIKI